MAQEKAKFTNRFNIKWVWVTYRGNKNMAGKPNQAFWNAWHAEDKEVREIYRPLQIGGKWYVRLRNEC